MRCSFQGSCACNDVEAWASETVPWSDASPDGFDCRLTRSSALKYNAYRGRDSTKAFFDFFREPERLMSESSTTRLINQVIRGDCASWDRFYDEVKPELRKLVEPHLRHWGAKLPAQATVIIDEALLRLIPSAGMPAAGGTEERRAALSFEHRGAFFALMCRVMMRVLVDLLRKEKRHQVAAPAQFGEETPAKSPGLTFHSKVAVMEALVELDQYYAEKNARRSVDQTLAPSGSAPLGSTHAAILFLRYWDDLADSEIAERLGMKKSTVQAQRKVAEARLRRMLERSFGE
jgi:DNA-directed RNA polymerase specialized sigma24 family protein